MKIQKKTKTVEVVLFGKPVKGTTKIDNSPIVAVVDDLSSKFAETVSRVAKGKTLKLKDFTEVLPGNGSKTMLGVNEKQFPHSMKWYPNGSRVWFGGEIVRVLCHYQASIGKSLYAHTQLIETSIGQVAVYALD